MKSECERCHSTAELSAHFAAVSSSLYTSSLSTRVLLNCFRHPHLHPHFCWKRMFEHLFLRSQFRLHGVSRKRHPKPEITQFLLSRDK